MKIAAFFDFDETLLAIDSASVGFRVLREQGYLKRSFMLKMMLVLFLRKIGMVNEQIMAKAFLSFYRGRSLQPFADSAEDFYSEFLQPNLAPQVVEKLKWHQEQEHLTVLVTGSIDYYLQPVMEDLGLDHLLCTHLETGSDGLLTGRSLGPVCVGKMKVELAQNLAREQNIDLSRSYAYGNSELDIPILEQVGHPVIVNPTPALQKYATKLDWPLL
ncbi:MAG: HAD-IB family hydrolase [Candidatus Marinimicrobia bacterium]|nr:HAD-IB family hydrolase [Candidatus Neomarinimicrobiota bacterium]